MTTRAPRRARQFFVHRRIVDRQQLQVTQQIINLIVRHLKTEILGRHVLDLMRFVEDDRAVVGDDLAVLAAAKGKVGEEEMMIDDDDVCVLRALAHARDEARVVVGTLLAETGFGARVNVSPER